jgi:hypothetical protein
LCSLSLSAGLYFPMVPLRCVKAQQKMLMPSIMDTTLKSMDKYLHVD